MYTVRVKSELDDRLDAEFYNPVALETVIKLEKTGTTQSLGNLIEDGYRVVYHGTDSINGIDDSELLPFLSPTQIDDQGSIDFSSTDKLPLYYKEKYPRGLAITGELLVEVKGNVSKVGIIPDSFPENLMISGSLYKASLKKSVDSSYLLAFLKSKHGQILKNRLTSNTIINYIAKDALYSITILLPNSVTQKYIGDKVRQAERLRAWAKVLMEDIHRYFENLSANPPSSQTTWRVSQEVIDAYRINPKQYDPVVLGLLNRARNKGIILQPLDDLMGIRGLAGGATPKGANYIDNGVLFARVQNVKPLTLDLGDAVFIDESADNELARSRCKENDVILTITGYPGTASLVTEEDLPVNINQHSVRFDIKNGVGAGYICAALNSRFLKYQIDRASIGGTRDALDYPSVRNLLIPRFDSHIEEEINNAVLNVIAGQKLSKNLTTAAKLLVEGLIEGLVTEDELIAAQRGLDAGDAEADAAILRWLKTDGLDGEGQALFSDLDKVYELLTQVSSEA